ncbi:alpha/beta hydrolase [Pseudomonas sp. LRF_L74]|uniref:alpha/beta hydrolase n=1 Tax=Pseudomonas sp. LRF_L74 TaxID=3369422 RepID=UPI003F5F974D
MTVVSRRSILCALAALPLAGRLAAEPRGDRQPAEVIDDPRVDRFDLGPAAAPWRIFVGRPRVAAPASGYSALIALDGNAAFPLLWRAREALAPDAPVVIVGLGYPSAYRFDSERRFFDLTPVTPAEHFGDRRSDRATGGRAAFLDFIAGELPRALARRVPLDPTRQTLFGHSLGGLFTLYALYRRPQLFSRYVAADPSIWWNQGSILDDEARFRETPAASGAPPIHLLIENSGAERHARSDVRATAEYSAHLVAQRLAASGKVAVRYRAFPEETHPSLLAPALGDALLFHLDRLPTRP